MTTVGARLGAVVAVDPTRPMLTWYDDGNGERAELSGATLANWVAKTANLLVDGEGLEPGDGAGVLLPPHWQTAAILLGCWSAGLTVVDAPGSAQVGSAQVGSAQVGFATPERAAELTQPSRYLVGLHGLGLPLRQVPEGYLDYAVEVRGHGDRFTPPGPVPDQDDLLGAAAARAAELEIEPGDRVMIDAAKYPDPLDWLLAPLAIGASTVLCGHLNPEEVWERVGAERVTRNLAW